MDLKADLRRQQRERLRRLSPEARARESRALCDALRVHPRVATARALGVFLPLRDEPDITPLLAEWLAEGRFLAIPRPLPGDLWSFCPLRDLAEPNPACPRRDHAPYAGILDPIPPSVLDVMLVPGLAFDATGWRLGRGGGVYDRLLAGYTGLSIGCALAAQRVERVPREAHDIRLDLILP